MIGKALGFGASKSTWLTNTSRCCCSEPILRSSRGSRTDRAWRTARDVLLRKVQGYLLKMFSLLWFWRGIQRAAPTWRQLHICSVLKYYLPSCQSPGRGIGERDMHCLCSHYRIICCAYIYIPNRLTINLSYLAGYSTQY